MATITDMKLTSTSDWCKLQITGNQAATFQIPFTLTMGSDRWRQFNFGPTEIDMFKASREDEQEVTLEFTLNTELANVRFQIDKGNDGQVELRSPIGGELDADPGQSGEHGSVAVQ